MSVDILKDRFSIGNDFVSKTFRIEKGRLVSFSLTNELSGKTLTPAEGSEVFALRFCGPFGGELIKASELKVQDALPAEDASGWTLKVFFKPFRVRGCKIELQYAETLGRMDSFLSAYLELRTVGSEKAVLDYLDFAPLSLREGEKHNAVRLPGKRKESIVPVLGQPLFLEHAFFGCTFPASLNAELDGRLCARRYYGRSLSALCGESGRFVSDAAVCGVAPKEDPVSVRKAFLLCLEKLLPPAQPQRVLWFASSPLEKDACQALLEEDKRLQAGGTPFYDTVLLDQRSVFPENAPFAFPEQIPMGLRSFCAAAAALGASPGLAVGLPVKSKGLFRRKDAGGVFCLAEEPLLASFRSFVLALSEKCGVTDWQLHLPMEKLCREKHHVHPIGGDHQLYYCSDLFEKWINCLVTLKKTAKKPLRFSLCGAYSPWLLQWVDGIGLPLTPDSADPGGQAAASAFSDLFGSGICVPPERLFSPLPHAQAPVPSVPFLRNLFFPGNPDPFALQSLRAEQGRLRALLGATVPFDCDAGEGCRVFAAFGNGEGLLTLCSRTGEPCNLSLTLDETLGVQPRFLCVGVCELLPKPACVSRSPLRFGDSLTQPLAPFETKVLHLGRRKTAPVCVFSQASDLTTVHLRFDRPVELSAAACAENPVQAVAPDGDLCGAALRLTYPFAQRNTVRLTGVRDLFGEAFDVTAVFMYSENGLLPPGALCGTGAFSIKVTFGSEANLQMYVQTERLSLVAEDGHITFRVGDAVLRSNSRTDDAVQVCAVREPGGTLKLYLNGTPDASCLPLSPLCELVPAAPLCFDEKRTRLYARALAFDEV